MEPTIISVRAPAAGNYSTSIGLAVSLTAVATGEARATLLTAADDGTLSNAPLGIIVTAENMNGGAVGVCVAGPCKARAGATITPGTDVLLMVAGDSRLDPCTDGNFHVARFVGKQVAADGDYIDVVIAIGNLENT